MIYSYRLFLLILFIGGLILGISFPFVGGFFPLSFIALVPLILFNIEINKIKKRRFIKRFLGNYIYFVTYNIFTTWWIYNASPEGSYMAFVTNSLLMTIPFFFFGFIIRQSGTIKGFISLIAVWIAFEYVHHYWDLSWPWLSFGNIFGNFPILIQWYEYSGIEGGTLWVLIVNIAVYILFRNRFILKEEWKIQAPNFVFLVLSLFVPIISSLIIYYTYDEKNDPVNVVIVQPNLNPYTAKFSSPVSDQIDKMLFLAQEKVNEETDLVLLPETAVSTMIQEKTFDYHPLILKIKDFSAKNNNLPVLTGADSYEVFETYRPFPARDMKNGVWLEAYNTALMIDANNPIQIYHKSKLVLGVEKLPFATIFPFLGEYSITLGGTASVLVGEKNPKLLSAKGINYSPLICYESVYGEFVSHFTRKGSDIITVITNDGWWDDTPGYKQHCFFSSIRAIENRRAVVRSANTGISCAINQRGDIIERLDWDVEGAISATVNKNDTFTFFIRYGDLTGRISSFLFLGMLLIAITNYLRNKGIIPQKKK